MGRLYKINWCYGKFYIVIFCVIFMKVLEDRRAAEAIREAVEGGAVSLGKIAKTAGLSYGSTSRLMSDMYGIPGLKKRRLKAIKNALNEGVNSLEELCKRAELRTGSGIIRYCIMHNLQLPEDLIPYRQMPKADVSIDAGLSLSEIGKEVDWSPQMVRWYIRASGQYELWSEKRRKVARSGDRKSVV